MLSQQDSQASHTWIVDLDGIDDEELDADDNVESGITTLLVDNSEIVPSEHKIVISPNKKRVFGKKDGYIRRLERLLSDSTTTTVSSVGENVLQFCDVFPIVESL